MEEEAEPVAVEVKVNEVIVKENSQRILEFVNPEDKIAHPNDIRMALIKEKRKKFAKKWFTKFNLYKKN